MICGGSSKQLTDVVLDFVQYHVDGHGPNNDPDPMASWHKIFRGLTTIKNHECHRDKTVQNLESTIDQLQTQTFVSDPVHAGDAQSQLSHVFQLLFSRYVYFSILRLDFIPQPTVLGLFKDYLNWREQNQKHPLATLKHKEAFLAYVLLRNRDTVMKNISTMKEHLGDRRFRVMEGEVKVWVDCVIRNEIGWEKKKRGKFALTVSDYVKSFLASKHNYVSFSAPSTKMKDYDSIKHYKLLDLSDVKEVSLLATVDNSS